MADSRHQKGEARMQHGKNIPAKKPGPPGNRITVEWDRCGTTALQVITVEQDSRNYFQTDGHFLLIFSL